MRRLFNSPGFVLLLVCGAIGFLVFNLAPVFWSQSINKAPAVPPVDFAEPNYSNTAEKRFDGSRRAPVVNVPNIGWLEKPHRNPFRFGQTALIGKDTEVLSQNALPEISNEF